MEDEGRAPTIDELAAGIEGGAVRGDEGDFLGVVAEEIGDDFKIFSADRVFLIDEAVGSEELVDEVEVRFRIGRLMEFSAGVEGCLPVDAAIEEAGEAGICVGGVDLF